MLCFNDGMLFLEQCFGLTLGGSIDISCYFLLDKAEQRFNVFASSQAVTVLQQQTRERLNK